MTHRCRALPRKSRVKVDKNKINIENTIFRGGGAEAAIELFSSYEYLRFQLKTYSTNTSYTRSTQGNWK